MMYRRWCRVASLGATLAFALLPVRAAGQTLRVRVIDRESRTPLPGVIVSLLAESDGQRLAAALSDELGGVRLTAPAGTRARIRAERIGYATSMSEGFDLDNSLRVVEIELTARAMQLSSVAVTAHRGCQATREGTQAATVWAEIQKALAATVLSDTRRLEMQIWRYVRSTDPELRVLAETTSTRVATAGPPFNTAPPAQLSRDGFIQVLKDVPTYFAPDAVLLLADEFVSDHCFGLRSPSPDAPVIGLTFRPIPSRRVTDISGVLWVNRQTGELLWLEYTYVGRLADQHAAFAGGRLDFALLPGGEWIVDQWYIRVPRRAEIRGNRVGRMEVAARDTLIGYREEGGFVVRGGAAAVSPANRARVSGLAFDSTAGRPLVDARVSLAGGAYQSRTDATGRYSIEAPIPGRYVVTLDHPRLQILEVGPVELDAVLSRGSNTTLNFSVPGIGTIRNNVCPGLGNGPGTGVIAAQVVDSASGAPIAGAAVTVSWRAASLRRTDAGAIAATADSAQELVSGPEGSVLLCGRPADARLTLRAELDGRRVEKSVSAGDSLSITEVILPMSAERGGSNTLTGRVLVRRGGAAQPAVSAEVLLPALPRSVQTRADGSFTVGRLRQGRTTLLVRSVGYQPVVINVQLPLPADSAITVTLEPLAMELARVVVTGAPSRTGRLREFEERRATIANGQFLTRDDLAKREQSQLSDVLRSIPGARLRRQPDGSTLLVSSRGQTIRGAGARDCPFQIYLDGIRVFAPGGAASRPPDINDFALSSLEAIEVYASPATTPPQFGGLGAACGTIVMWTRVQ